jgi:hypothetical protein
MIYVKAQVGEKAKAIAVNDESRDDKLNHGM